MGKDLTTKLVTAAVSLGLVIAAGADSQAGEKQFRRLAVKDYVDKMKAGSIGQMAGAGWGGPTEFRFSASGVESSLKTKCRNGNRNW
ncbi:MAG: hypothetical protein ACYSXD_12210 [Planctomycetota bacterium]|jgi:hypothetical protein